MNDIVLKRLIKSSFSQTQFKERLRQRANKTESSFDDLSIQLEGSQETALQNLVDSRVKALFAELEKDKLTKFDVDSI